MAVPSEPECVAGEVTYLVSERHERIDSTYSNGNNTMRERFRDSCCIVVWNARWHWMRLMVKKLDDGKHETWTPGGCVIRLRIIRRPTWSGNLYIPAASSSHFSSLTCARQCNERCIALSETMYVQRLFDTTELVHWMIDEVYTRYYKMANNFNREKYKILRVP